jgi:hypothetical protein
MSQDMQTGDNNRKSIGTIGIRYWADRGIRDVAGGRKMRNWRTKLFAILLCCLATGVVLAQVSENYDLSWNVIGGGATGSANHAIRSTVGQAAFGYSSSDNYGLGTGY